MKNTLLLFFFFCSLCRAQNKQIDSLLEVLKTEKADTSKVNALNALSEKLDQTAAYEKAKDYGNDALQLSEKINYKKGKASAYAEFGNICCDQGNYTEALKNYLISLKTSQEISDKEGIANGYLGLGNAYYAQGNNPEAFKNLLASLKIMQEIGNKRGIAQCYICLRYVGTFEEALNYLNSALKIFNEIDDKEGASSCYLQISAHYFLQHNYPEALKNCLASLKIAEAIGNKKSTAINYGNISSIYLKQDNYPEALKFSLKALKILEETGDREGILSTYNRLGNIYARERKFDVANKYLRTALSMVKEIGLIPKTIGIYKDLIGLDSMMGDYKQGMTDFKIYDFYKDSLHTELAIKQTQEIKGKYEAEKKEKEIALLTKDKQLQTEEIKKQTLMKNAYIGGLVLVILLSFFGYRLYRSRQILRLQEIRNTIAADLHDEIGSTLNSISIFSEVAKQKDERHEESLEMIGESSRTVIETMSDIIWAINVSNDSFEKIIFRMNSFAHNLLGAKGIEYSFNADESLNEKKLSLEDRRNFYLIFKEAVNNIVKHSQATEADISLTDNKDHILLTIVDNGAGFEPGRETAGNGLKNMKRRAAAMASQLEIKSAKGQGTQLKLIFAS